MSYSEEICPQCECKVRVDRERGFSYCGGCGTRVYLRPESAEIRDADDRGKKDASEAPFGGYTSISQQEFERLRQENSAMSFSEYGIQSERGAKRGGIITFVVLLLVCVLAAGGMVLLLNSGDWSHEREELAAKIQEEALEEQSTSPPEPTPTPAPTPTPEPEPALDLSAAQAMTIAQLYEKSENGEQLSGKSAAVSGAVESVKIDGARPVVTLVADGMTVACEFDADYAEEAVTLSAGDSAVVAGIIDSADSGGASMRYCRLTNAFDSVFAELEPSYGKVINVKKDANVREKPNTDCEVLGSAPKGGVYRITGESDDWFEIDFDGKKGYISRDYFEITDVRAEQYRKEAVEPDYKEITQNPDSFSSQKFKVTVKIDEYDEGGGVYHAHKSSKKWLIAYGAPDAGALEKGKSYTFYGEFAGLEKADGDDDGDEALPMLGALYCDAE